MARFKKNKKGRKETDEEKRVRMEVSRLKDDESRRQRDEALKQRLRERLALEERYAATNRQKVQTAWRRILLVAKMESLKEEVENARKLYEGQVVRLDAHGVALQHDLEEAETEYQFVLQTHVRNVDALINLHKARVSAVQHEFERDVNTLQDEFRRERTALVAQYECERREMSNVRVAVENSFKDEETDMKQEFESLREELRNRTQEEQNIVKYTLEGIRDELERHLKLMKQDYQAETGELAQVCHELELRDRESRRAIDANERKLRRLQEAHSYWKNLVAQNAKNFSERNSVLHEERDAVMAHLQALKTRMNAYRSSERRRLADLSSNTRNAVHTLTMKLDQAEKIMKLGEVIQRLETEREKVYPFYTSSLTEEEIREATEAHRSQARGDLVGLANHDWDELNNFYKRHNKVLLDSLAITKERNRLLSENQQLRLLLKEYFEGVAVSDSVLNKPNTLMMVGLAPRIRQLENDESFKAPPVVEASLVVQTQYSHTAHG